MLSTSYSRARQYIAGLAILILGGLLIGSLAAISPPGSVVLLAVLASMPVILLAFTRPYAIVVFLAVFMPFENVVLRYVPGSDQLYVASRFFSESLLYLTFGFLVFRRVIERKGLRKTPIDAWVAAFVFVALLAILINRSPLSGALVNLRSQLRYMVLFYLAANLDITPEQIRRLVHIIVAIGVLQVLIGVLQLVAGSYINPFLLPRETAIQVAGFSRGFRLLQDSREIGSIFGTLGDTLFFSLFILTVLFIYLGHTKRLRTIDAALVLAFFLAINYAFTRAVVFASLLLLVLFLRTKYGLNRVLTISLFALPTVLIGLSLLASLYPSGIRFVNPLKERVSIVENIVGVFNTDYFRRAQQQRLGALLGIPPTVILNRPIFGYGPDEETTIGRLNNSRPSYLLRSVVKQGFEDVYWVALLSYYGIAGISALAMLFLVLYREARKIYTRCSEESIKGLALGVTCMVGVTPFLLFFYRVLEFRSFSFYFWLWTGLLFGVYCRSKITRRHL